MKKIKLFGLIATIVFAFTSCDMLDEVKDAIDEIQDDQEAQYVESEDGLEITVSYKQSGVGIYHTAKFEPQSGDTICTSFISKTTYPAEFAAKEAYDNIVKDKSDQEKEFITLKGKEITIDHPNNVGKTKAVIKFGLMSIYQGYKKGGEIVSNIEIPEDGNGDGDND